MSAPNRFRILPIALALSFAALSVAGCEGLNRKHDARVGNIEPVEDDLDARPAHRAAPHIADDVEEMMAARKAYIDRLIELERAYLEDGHTEKANWARRQREQTEKIEVYPYLTEDPPEKRSGVAPRESIPEADALYDEAYALYDTFVGVPFVGFTKLNHRDARRAADLFRQLLREHPTSDKVDDAAYYTGAIYKEFLREDDPDNQLALRYFKWAVELDPKTPHPARFDMAAVYDFRLHDRARAIELYNDVLETEEAGNNSNQRFAATRIEQLTDDDRSHLRPRDRRYVRGASNRTASHQDERTTASTYSAANNDASRD